MPFASFFYASRSYIEGSFLDNQRANQHNLQNNKYDRHVKNSFFLLYFEDLFLSTMRQFFGLSQCNCYNNLGCLSKNLVERAEEGNQLDHLTESQIQCRSSAIPPAEALALAT